MDTSPGEVDQLVLLCVDQVCTKQGVAIPWDLVGKEINDTLTGEAIKQHLVKMKKAREQHGQQVPDSLGAAEPRKSAAATPLKTRSIKAKNQEEKKSMKDAPLRHLVYLPEKKTPTKSRGKKMPNNVDTIKSTPSKTSTSKASDSVTTPPADEVQPGSRSSKRARRPSKKAAVEDANDSEAGSPSKKVKVAKPQVGEALSPTRWLKVTKPELGSSSKKAKVTKPEVDIPSKKANVTQPQPQQRPMRDTKLRNLPKLDYRELHVEEENEVAGIQGIKTSRAVAGNVEPTPSFQRTSLGMWSFSILSHSYTYTDEQARLSLVAHGRYQHGPRKLRSLRRLCSSESRRIRSRLCPSHAGCRQVPRRALCSQHSSPGVPDAHVHSCIQPSAQLLPSIPGRAYADQCW